MAMKFGQLQGQFTKYLPRGLCNRNCVILQTNRARCALNEEILDLLNEESISGMCSGKSTIKSLPQVFEKVSQLLKCNLNFFFFGGGGHIYIYIYILIPWLNVVTAENV